VSFFSLWPFLTWLVARLMNLATPSACHQALSFPLVPCALFLVVGWLANWSRGNAQVRSALFFCIGMGAKLKEENPMTLFVGIMRKKSNRSKDGVLIITSFED